jgi:tetratricopeptide (TPR) repeat protein
MELNEEKELKKVIDDLTAAVRIFRTKDYAKAADVFESIVEQYKDSEYYSVLEIQARAKVYRNICNNQLHPVQVVCTSDEDYLNEALFLLNQKKFDKAQEFLEPLGKKKFKEPYVNYLLSIVYLKKKDVAKTIPIASLHTMTRISTSYSKTTNFILSSRDETLSHDCPL